MAPQISTLNLYVMSMSKICNFKTFKITDPYVAKWINGIDDIFILNSVSKVKIKTRPVLTSKNLIYLGFERTLQFLKLSNTKLVFLVNINLLSK